MGRGIDRNCAQDNIATDGLGHSYSLMGEIRLFFKVKYTGYKQKSHVLMQAERRALDAKQGFERLTTGKTDT